jgi:ABC-type dipeptide/oligopeptide/nickel transport system ATPase component
MSQRGTGHAGSPAVSFEEVSKVYGHVRAVAGLSLSLHRGEPVAFLGPNGAGKSTSLDMLLALRKPTSGRIRVLGADPYAGVKSGRVGAMLQGRLLADGTPAEIKARAGAKRLSFRSDRVDETFLLGLPALVNLEIRHDLVQIQSADSDRTLYALLDAGYRPREIEVSSLGAGVPGHHRARRQCWPGIRTRRVNERTGEGDSPMNGTLALTQREMVRLSRNKRYLIFSIALPVMLYLVFGKQATSTAYCSGSPCSSTS